MGMAVFRTAFVKTRYGRLYMNIAAIGNSDISLSVSGTSNMNAIDTALLKKSLDAVETNGAMLTQMMEQSVNPNIGANIDIRL